MRRTIILAATLVTIVALMLMTSCIQTPKQITSPPATTPTPESTPTPEPAMTPIADWGIIEIRATDPPPANVTSAVVYLTNIEVHQVSDNASGWITITGAPPSFDLMEVINGVEALLGSANVTAGKYTQIRMDVDRVEVVTAAGDNVTAEVPSDKLKIVRPFNVEPGMTTALTLDFDGEKSLVITGQDKALFKPVVKLLINYEGEKEEAEIEEEEAEEQEFEGTIDNIEGTTWTMTIDGESRTVDVSEAEIEGEAAVGLEAEVKGTVTDNTIVASEVEIEEAEEEEEE
ncbi:DUF4382 domain-containing protein [Chloroflexota bacterium]